MLNVHYNTLMHVVQYANDLDSAQQYNMEKPQTRISTLPKRIRLAMHMGGIERRVNINLQHILLLFCQFAIRIVLYI